MEDIQANENFVSLQTTAINHNYMYFHHAIQVFNKIYDLVQTLAIAVIYHFL